MTSLEGSRRRSAELSLCRSGGIPACRKRPWITVVCRPVGHATGTSFGLIAGDAQSALRPLALCDVSEQIRYPIGYTK